MANCAKCQGLGILLAKVKGEGTETLVYCDCYTPKVFAWRLVTLNDKVRNAFDLSRCPAEWFRPSKPGQAFELKSVSQKIEHWHQRLKAAEKFWKEWEVIFKDEVKPHWSANY